MKSLTPRTSSFVLQVQFLNLLIRDTEAAYLENKLNVSLAEFWLGFNVEEYGVGGLTVSGVDVFPTAEADKDCVRFLKDGDDEKMERTPCGDLYYPLCQRPLRLAPTQVTRNSAR